MFLQICIEDIGYLEYIHLYPSIFSQRRKIVLKKDLGLTNIFQYFTQESGDK